MVAYSFDKRFADCIRTGRKRQTIRSHRRRHARPGERMQLYTGMRTRACELLRDDVECAHLREFEWDLRGLDGVDPETPADIERAIWSANLPMRLDGFELDAAAVESLAILDGFGCWQLSGVWLSPVAAMVTFWMARHGPVLFEGVLITWRPVGEQPC